MPSQGDRLAGAGPIIDYCKVDPREALRESPLLREIADGDLYGRYRGLRDAIYQEEPPPGERHPMGLLGEGGDCGNFAIALNRHLCNRGSLLALVNQFQAFDEVPLSHIVVQYDGALLDSAGVHGSGGGVEEMDLAKRRLAERWVNDPELWSLYGGRGWGEMSEDERLGALDPVAITVTEDEIKEKLPRTTYEDRIWHLRDFFCRVEGTARFDPDTGRCENGGAGAVPGESPARARKAGRGEEESRGRFL
jgi:hypothetical protein